jgi:hypothetical protein
VSDHCCGLATSGRLAARDCANLAERLRTATAEIHRLAPLVSSKISGEQAEDWSAIEVLAHMAMLSAYFTTTALKAAAGQDVKGDLLEQIRARDLITPEFTRLPALHLAELAETYLARAISFLETPEPVALARLIQVSGDWYLSVLEVIRLGVCAHLEMHLEQLRTAMEREGAVMSAPREI